MSSVLKVKEKSTARIDVDEAARTTSRLLTIARILAIADVAFCAVAWFAAYSFDGSRLWDDSLAKYSFGGSALDVSCLVSARVVATLVVLFCYWRSPAAADNYQRRGRSSNDRGLAFLQRSSIVQFLVAVIKLLVLFFTQDVNKNLWGVASEAALFACLQFNVFNRLIKAVRRERLGLVQRDRLLAVEEGGATSNDDEEDEEDESIDGNGLSLLRLLSVLRPYFWPRATHESAFWNRLRAVTTWVFVLSSKGINVIAPLFIAKATDALNNGHYHKAGTYSCVYAALLLASKAFKEAQGVIYLKVAQAAFIELAEDTFGHMHGLSLQWHLKKKLGDVMRNMDRGISACDTLMKYLFLYLIPALAECISVCIVFATIFKSFAMSITCFISVAIYCYMTVKLTLWRQQFRKAVNKHDNKWHDIATDSLVNFETVKYFTNEDFEVSRFSGAVQAYQKFSVSVQASLSLLNVFQQVLVNGTLAIVLLLAAREVKNGNMSTGDFVATLSYVLSLFTPLNYLGSVYNAIVNAFVDLTNLSQLLAEQPDVRDAPNAPDFQCDAPEGLLVEFDHICFHYPEQPPENGLNGVSFTVSPGTTTAIVGHTGAGKTTISRLLFRFYDPLQGAVRFNGSCLSTVTQASVRKHIGVVPQDTVLFNDTIFHNIAYGRLGCTTEEIEAAAEAAQILDFIRSLPEGFETVVGERGLKLSGGEKQRVAIARCILKNPPLVLLDEATSALDSKTEHSVQTALANLSQNRTTIVIAHRLGTIAHADQILVLNKGRVAERGSHEALLGLGKHGEYSQLWNMQLKAAQGMDEEKVEGGTIEGIEGGEEKKKDN
jgi:ABC-type transport system involved in Fe-S cluster assembly fused permease/ATPase subunit